MQKAGLDIANPLASFRAVKRLWSDSNSQIMPRRRRYGSSPLEDLDLSESDVVLLPLVPLRRLYQGSLGAH